MEWWHLRIVLDREGFINWNPRSGDDRRGYVIRQILSRDGNPVPRSGNYSIDHGSAFDVISSTRNPVTVQVNKQDVAADKALKK